MKRRQTHLHTHTRNLQCCQQRHRPSHRESPLCVCTGAGKHQDECHHKRVKAKPCVRCCARTHSYRQTFARPFRIVCICSVLTPAGRIHSSALRLGRRAGQLQGLSSGIKRKDSDTMRKKPVPRGTVSANEHTPLPASKLLRVCCEQRQPPGGRNGDLVWAGLFVKLRVPSGAHQLA